MRHPKSLAVSYKLLIINNSILSQQKSDEVGIQRILSLILRAEYCEKRSRLFGAY